MSNLSLHADDEGVTLTIDRFDPGREVTGHSDKIPIALLPGDFLIPCTVDNQGPVSKRINVYAPEDFSAAFKVITEDRQKNVDILCNNNIFISLFVPILLICLLSC